MRIFRDASLRVSVVVETGGELWLVPRRPGGWSSRQRLAMTDAARAERLTPARDVQPDWLGISPSRIDAAASGVADASSDTRGSAV